MKVYNYHHKDAPPGCVEIMRGTRWGNRWVVGKDGTREEVLRKYQNWLDLNLEDDFFMEELRKLSQAPGLLCACKPKRCHGDLLVAAMRKLGFLLD